MSETMRARYTLESKLEAVRLIKDGQRGGAAAVTLHDCVVCIAAGCFRTRSGRMACVGR